MPGTMTTLEGNTPRIDRTTPRIAALPTASVERSAFNPVQQAIVATTNPKIAVLSVAGTTSESLRNTSVLFQNSVLYDLPTVSWATRLPSSAEASMITVSNGTASAQAIARGATSVGSGSAPSRIRASIPSFNTIELSSAARPAPMRAATNSPARI